VSRSSDNPSQSPPQSQSTSQVNDYFGTFLESVKQASPEYPDQPPASSATTTATTGVTTGQDVTAEPGSTISAITILATLAATGPAMPLTDLLAELGISWMQAGSILSPLVESNFVTITGDPGSEMVQLTEDGTRLTTGVV
jgi:predicted transcriptional regulator